MTVKELDVFCTTGIRAATASSVTGLVPRILFPFLKPGTMRRLYPLVADGSGVRTLAGIVDDLMDASPSDGDALEQERRILYRLEQEIAREAGLDERLDAVLERIPTGTSTKQAPKLRERLVASAGTGHLLPDTPEGLGHAMIHTAQTPYPPDLEWLSTRLHDLLDVDRNDHSELTLSHSTGGSYSDTIDFGSLSHLLDDTPLATAMDPERRARIERVLEDLESGIEEVYGHAEMTFDSVATIDAESTRRTNAFAGLMRARKMAQLEVENRYRPDIHDPSFASFNAGSVTIPDMAWFPPVIGHLHEPHAMPVALHTSGRIRLLVTFDTLFTAEGDLSPHLDTARMLVGSGQVRVQQLTLSLAPSLIEGLTATATAERSSVTVVYTGAAIGDRYLSSAVACDTRLVPTFRFDPDAGPDWADRFDLSDNEQSEDPWAVLDGREATPADVLSMDERFGHFFTALPSDMETGTWESIGSTTSGVLLDMASENGDVVQAAAAPTIVRSVKRTATSWRMLQEWAGIRSSLVERARAAFEDDIRSLHTEELVALSADHERTLSERTEELAERIVHNIAAGLLGVHATTPTVTATTRQGVAQPVPVAEAEPVEPELAPAPEEDDEDLVLDDAYIDTPLCTSCNECTNLNGLIFSYNGDKQAFIKDAAAGPYRDLVLAAEKCPVRIIHPGKPIHADEPGLAEWVDRAAPFL